jgi:hypothetical protein
MLAAIAPRLFRRKLTPEEAERQRRELIHRDGKLGDGEIIDVDGLVLIYSYAVAGVNYTVSQDATALTALLPEDRMSLVGPVLVKFLPRNPPNSIVLSEAWSGLRNPPA